MKKTIIYLGLALVAFSNVAVASNVNSSTTFEKVSTYVSATPLCVAISKGDMEVVKKFVEYGADVNEKSNGLTPLMIAVRYNNVEMIKYLIDKGANVKAKDDKGLTALRHAEKYNAKDAAAYLKELS
ncbi:ankyrin repeat domain-containing protein [Flavobacterium sp. '19STA2R22 D10 B1']|uniref:ankyrin repeat domain-containing protein n=1 Tax=Flavobacterium aerium TaxID=3037261 RepID=UPI00278C619C|nr:ankyrin repeat domain-containing protein [Flavobacterium sp. '19STA2R22 D10 B1']